MKRILIVQDTITHYNLPVFEAIGCKYDLTVMHSDGRLINKEYKFKSIYNSSKKKIFKYHTQSLTNIANNYDIVICMLLVSYFDVISMCYTNNRKYKLILWGIGVSAGYRIRFDKNPIYPFFYQLLIRRADAAIFYSEYSKNKYIRMKIDTDKLYVANNTVMVDYITPKDNRNIFLFVGSLYKEKRVDLLIEQYYIASKSEANLERLFIIGDGDQKDLLEKIIIKRHLEDKVILCGKITNSTELIKYYEKAVVSFSPDQAGLSVLQSMGYGVPFVTYYDAITGGERLNIIDGINGVLMKKYSEIHSIFLDAHSNSQKYLLMGKNAFDFYWKERTIDSKIKGFFDAISYCINMQNDSNLK